MKSSKWCGLVITIFGCLFAARQTAFAQWIQQTSGTNMKLTDVVMLDSLTALCVGDSGRILKTTDAGLTWLTKHSGVQQWNGIAFVNPTNGLVVGNRMAVAATTDGGETWSPWAQSGPPHLLTVTYVGMTSVFIGSDSGYIFYSHNGVTWHTFRFGSEPVNCIFGARGDFLPVDMYAITPRTANKSTDLGGTWTAQPLPITPWGSALGGAMAPTSSVFIVGFDGNPGPVPVILRRALADTSWIKFIFMPPVLPRIVRDVVAPSSQVAFACGSLGIMFKTIDGGHFWSYHNSGTQRNLNAIHFLNDRRGFAVGDSGTILFTSNGGLVPVNNPALSPEQPLLYQNYPNPFSARRGSAFGGNPTTTIQYSLPQSTNNAEGSLPARLAPASAVRAGQARAGVGSLVTLKVYDVLGREVATLVDETKHPGTYTVQWLPSGRASGVYFYQMRAGEFVQTRKLLLLR